MNDTTKHDFFVNGPGGELHIYDSGSAERPIILIPALGGTIKQWNAQIKHLQKNHRMVAIEPRGHGKSHRPPDRDYSLAAMAGDVEAVANNLSLSRFVIAGHSFGGVIAIAYAAAHPERVAGLLLADPSDDSSARPALRRWLGRILLKKFPFETHWNRLLEGAKPEDKASVLDDLRNLPREVLFDVIRANSDFNASAALAKYPGPIVSLVTRFVDVRSALHKVCSRIRVVPVDGTSHWLQMDDPTTFNRHTDDFLGSLKF